MNMKIERDNVKNERVSGGVESWFMYNNTPQKHFTICGEANDQVIPITFL